MISIPVSVLDLSPICEGGDASSALQQTLDLARHADRLGFHRYWLAEHHNMTGIASAATAVVIGHVAAGTQRIRVGAGGVMLPNHAPLVIAEQFGTLAALFPGRIDLGLGRAPGTDQRTAMALRRHLHGGADTFEQDVQELIGYFRPALHGQAVRAVPGAGLDVPVWILGSSLYGAQLAAALGLPYSFASHFAPASLMDAIAIYRRTFRPSVHLAKPHVMVAANVFAADSDAAAQHLFTSLQQAFVNLIRGNPGQLPAPVDTMDSRWLDHERQHLSQSLSCSFVGTKASIAPRLEAFIEQTGADELIVTAQIHDHAARVRSFELVSELRA